VFKPFETWFEALRFAAEAQRVMALRMARFAVPDASTAGEVAAMIGETTAAFAEAQLAVGTALATGRSFETVMRRAYRPYRRRVHANHRRLSP
jgi:hypothetical protein